MAQGKTQAELEDENSFLRTARLSESSVQIGLSFIRWGGIVLVARYIYFSIQALAGTETSADIFVKFLSNLSLSISLSWICAIASILYGLAQRKLRKDTIERLQGRIREFEQEKDSKRSSSRLTERGETRREDRL